MTKFDNTIALLHLQQKWGQRACPMCGKGPWNVQNRTFQLIEYDGGNLIVGGPVIPVVPVTCGNCGYTALVNAIISGVVGLPPTTGEGDTK